MLTGEMKSACQIRTLYGLPCERCKYAAKCSAYKKQNEKLKNQNKEGKKQNEQKKQRKRRRKEDSDN